MTFVPREVWPPTRQDAWRRTGSSHRLFQLSLQAGVDTFVCLHLSSLQLIHKQLSMGLRLSQFTITSNM